MTGLLQGKRALVTGAGSGIGLGIAKAFAAEGARVCFACYPPDALPNDALAQIHKAGGTAFALAADVADEQQVTALFAAAIPQLGGLEILVNGAGIMEEQALADHATSLFDRTIAVNLRGTFLVGRAGIAAMRSSMDASSGPEQGGGRIINFASDLGYLGRANFSAYCASKGAILALTRSWARELTPAILVNAIAPGPIETPMLRRSLANPDVLEQELDSPMARIGDVSEVAASALFLAGPGASFMTGQTLNPNGGSVMP
ncbi:MAG: SDR family oxidoreductase [Dongiaceae bacterium]